MEDLFSPDQGLRWTAKAAAGYTLTTISSKGKVHGEGQRPLFPSACMRLAGFCSTPFSPPLSPIADPFERLPRLSTMPRLPVFCCPVHATPPIRLWAVAGRKPKSVSIPQSGLLQLHSEAPGRYAVYDYTSAPEIGGHILPRSVTITEGGRVVSTISVESLQQITAPIPSLFVPSDAMKAAGRRRPLRPRPNLPAFKDTGRLPRPRPSGRFAYLAL